MKLVEVFRQMEKIIQIASRPNEIELRVISHNYGPQVGGRRMVNVKAISQGFDWEHGKVLLHTDPPVYDGVEEMQAAADFAYQVRDIMYTLSQDPTRNRNGNAIRMLKEGLDEWLPTRMEKEQEDGGGDTSAGGCSAT